MKRSTGASPFDLKQSLQELNWNKVGVVRQEPDLTDAVSEIEAIADEVGKMRVEGNTITLLKYAGAHRSLVHCVATLDTRFPEA